MVALTLLGGCAQGRGEGNAVGQVWAPDCNLNGEPFELNPNFFAMRPSTSVEIIDMRMQRGSDFPNFSDGVSFFIDEAEMVRDDLLGVDLEFELLGSMVEMTLYLNATCPGLARIPVVYRAVSGTIRFDSLYIPWRDDNETKETSAVFTNVELVDTQDPDTRRAILSGSIRFLFERGMPPQYFMY